MSYQPTTFNPMAFTLNKTRSLTISYSSLSLLNTCPRKFELYKIHPMADVPKDETPALVQGKAVGMGIAEWLETRDLDKAILKTWLSYWPVLEDKLRSQTKAINLVKALTKHQLLMSNRFKLAKLNGNPCTETSFCIKVDYATYFVGFLDAILVDSNDGSLLPLELKTTSMTSNIECLYKNSAQGNGYGLILDKIAHEINPDYQIGQTYDIQYLVAQVKRSLAEQYRPEIHTFKFTKTIIDRLEWLMEIKLQVKRIQDYIAVNLFSKDGSSCLAWNRPCAFYNLCTLAGKQLVFTEDETQFQADDEYMEYDFYFDLDELINDALQVTKEIT